MCGYVFSFDQSTTIPEKKTQGYNSLKLINHRGPDATNLQVTSSVLMGHCRLSIIDLEGSVQPMSDPSGRFQLAYNGEIYNYRDIRERLKNEWQFRTQGDTEVLLAALVLNKLFLLKSMEGMWSFVFWDHKKKQLIISRDRVGKKPAYYSLLQNGIVVASELRALKKLLPNAVEEDLNSTADFLRYGYYLPGTTAYKGIKEVLPGNTLIWSPHEKVVEEPYWQLTVNQQSPKKADVNENIYQLLVASVRKRMVADVEVGAFLSGGVDSSLIVSIMAKELNIKPKTFTIGFEDGGYDERGFAKLISDRFGTDHYEEILKDFNHEDLNDLILNHVGQPFSDSSILPTALVSKLASRHVKVALSGDGGDELFCGYQRYQARAILRWYTRLPSVLRNNIEKLVKVLPEPFTHHSNSLVKKAHLFVDITKRIDDETPYVAPVMYAREDFCKLTPELSNHGHTPINLKEQTDLDDIQSMMYADSLIYLPQDILLKVDRASMANSLETRAPFLDSALIELAFSFPSSWHKGLLRGKKILRTTFAKHLPSEIWNRRKQGFAVPVHNWFKGQLGRDLIEMAKLNESPISQKYLKILIDEHMDGRKDNGYRLWSLYTYFLWKNQSTKLAY